MAAFGPYSPVRQAGAYYFVSGQVGVDPATKTAAEDAVEQTHQAMKNLQTVLGEHRLTMHDVVKTTVFLKHMEDYPAVNEAYMAYFDEPRPARSCVGVSDLPHVGTAELLIEIEAIAHQPEASHAD